MFRGPVALLVLKSIASCVLCSMKKKKENVGSSFVLSGFD